MSSLRWVNHTRRHPSAVLLVVQLVGMPGLNWVSGGIALPAVVWLALQAWFGKTWLLRWPPEEAPVTFTVGRSVFGMGTDDNCSIKMLA